MIIMEIIELIFRTKSDFDDKKEDTGHEILLGVNRALRVFMMHRRLTDIYCILMREISIHVFKMTDLDKQTPKQLIQGVIKRLSPNDPLNKLALERVMKLLKEQPTAIAKNKRRPTLNRLVSSATSGMLNEIQKDFRRDDTMDLDKHIYDVGPDDEDIEKIFQCDEVGDDVRYTHILSFVESLDFNIFELSSVSNGNELVLIANHLLEINEFYEKLNIPKDKFRRYSVAIQKQYNPVSYHNKTHAADVTQTSYYFLSYCDFFNIGAVTDMEAAVLLISAMVHDTDHPGVNNLYLVATRDRLALRYNDKSVLENHHIAVSFNIMLRSKDTWIYENFTVEQYKQYREYMIDLVLATDNANHNHFCSEMEKRESSHDFDPTDQDKKLIMWVWIHLADISNPTKPWRLCYKWIDLLFLEFFKQGDKERDRNLPISFLMDRNTTNIAKAQGGFIDHFIKPAFDLLKVALPNIELNMRFLETNKEQWKNLEDSYSLENDPQVNHKKESEIIDESEFEPSETESSLDILQKDLRWRKKSIMVAQSKGIFKSISRSRQSQMSNMDKKIVRTFTGTDESSFAS